MVAESIDVAIAVDAEPVPVEGTDGDVDVSRAEVVAGAYGAGLEQPLPRGEEVQDHRVDDLPSQGDLVSLDVDEELLLAPVLGEAAVDGRLADEPPASRLRLFGELLLVVPVLREEQPHHASLLSHVEEREPHVGDEDVRLGTGLERLLGEGDVLESEQIVGVDGTEVLHHLGDAEEVDTHELTGFILRFGLLVGEPELLLDLLDEPLTEVGVVDWLLVEAVGHASVAQGAHEFGHTSQLLIGVAMHFGSLSKCCLYE